ncbi:MAG: tetratricopeptide repeat protein [Oscillatoria sp. SIO1A7]|nr:tetratricopeptide repeat protein [Oscillatoria sp. SIO1A7]
MSERSMTLNNRTANRLLWQGSMVVATLMLCIGAAEAQTPPTPRSDASPHVVPTPIPTPPPPPRPRVTPSPAARPTTQATPAPTAKPTEKPTTQTYPASTAKPAPKPTTQPTPATTAKPTEKQTTQPSPATTAKPTEKQTTEPSPATTAKPTEKQTTQPSPAPTATPAASPAGGDNPAQPTSDRPLSDPSKERVESLSSSEQEQIRQVVQDEVNRAFGRNASSLNWLLFAMTLFPIGATIFGIWLLRRNMANMVAERVKEEIGGELKAQIQAEIVGSLEGQENLSSNTALAALPAQAPKPDNTEHLNELISMAMATQKLINETRSTLEESMKFQDAIQQPFEDVLGVYLKQASELFREGQYGESIELCDRALQSNPELDLAWLERGMALTKLQKYEDAIASFNKALQINSDSAAPWYEKARCYALKNDPDLAVDNLKQAINRDASKREAAKADTDFQAIRGDEMLESLLSGL